MYRKYTFIQDKKKNTKYPHFVKTIKENLKFVWIFLFQQSFEHKVYLFRIAV